MIQTCFDKPKALRYDQRAWNLKSSLSIEFWCISGFFLGQGGRFDPLLFANVGQGLSKRYEKDFKHDSWDRSAGL